MCTRRERCTADFEVELVAAGALRVVAAGAEHREESHWRGARMATVCVFGYGSLVWRPDFPFTAAHAGFVTGFARRFFQASPDHRGTPALHGRVCTLVPVRGGAAETAVVHGTVFELPASTAAATMERLAHREQAGYSTWEVGVQCADGVERCALAFAATAANEFWRGPPDGDDGHEDDAGEPPLACICVAGGPPRTPRAACSPRAAWCIPTTAAVIAAASGRSGANAEYLLQLVAAMRSRGVHDEYLEALVSAVAAAAAALEPGGMEEGTSGAPH